MKEFTWSAMTEEERWAYVNQDIPNYKADKRLPKSMGYNEDKRSSKEVLQACNPDQYKRVSERYSLSEAITEDNTSMLALYEDLSEEMTHLERVCFHGYFIEKRSAKKIAASVSVQYLFDGDFFSQNSLSIFAVKAVIGRIRKKIRTHTLACA